jgi:hypothetical protein
LRKRRCIQHDLFFGHKTLALGFTPFDRPDRLGESFQTGFYPPGVGVKKGVKVERVEGDEKAALAALRKALDDFEKHEGPWAEHPFFGKLDKKKWTLLTSLHLANHLGWAKPKE